MYSSPEKSDKDIVKNENPYARRLIPSNNMAQL